MPDTPPPDPTLPDTPADALDAALAAAFAPDAPDPAPPDGAARYEIGDEIARGGMGAILRGRDTALGRDVAVKVLLEAHRGRAELARRFLDEARIAGRLQHPGVVPVYDVGTLPDRRPFFAMKLVEGRTLAALLRERASPSDDLPRLLKVFEQVCQTVAYAHSRGVIHRDLKPANVMVGAFGEVQLMDWGLAKLLSGASGGRQPPGESDHRGADAPRSPPDSSLHRGADAPRSPQGGTQAGAVLGTPAYMAPEQARGQTDSLDERCDVFGLGALLCEILTGKPPYAGADTDEVRARAERADLADALTRLDGCGADPELVRLARACLSADPAARPRHAGAVADAVAAHLASVQERLRAAEVERGAADARALAERKRRRTTLALAAAVVCIIALGGGGWVWVESDRQQRQARATTHAARALAEAELLGTLAKAAPEGDVAAWEKALAAARRAADVVAAGEVDDDTAGQVRNTLIALAAGRAAVEARAAALDRDRRIRAELAAVPLRTGPLRTARNPEPLGPGQPLRRFVIDRTHAEREYLLVFRDYGIDIYRPDEAVARIRASALRAELVAALDQWLALPLHQADRERFGAIADRADEPDLMRREVRAALIDRSGAALARLAARDHSALSPWATATLAVALRNADRFDHAVTVLRPARRRHPGDYVLTVELAYCLSNLKPPRLAEAARCLTAATALRTDEPMAHLLLSNTLWELGDREEAVAGLRRCLVADPNYADAHYNLGNFLRELGRLGEAIAAYREATRLDPGLFVAHHNLAGTLALRREFAAALASINRALELDPEPGLAHQQRGNILDGLGRLEEAAAAYGEALKTLGDAQGTLFKHGHALARLGRYAEATASLERAVALRPDDAAAGVSLGACLVHLKRHVEALAALRRAVALTPADAGAHYYLSAAFLSLDRAEEALAALREALALTRDNPEALYEMGRAFLELGRPAEAVPALRGCIALEPDRALAHLNLGLALRDTGAFADALASFRRTHELGSKLANWSYPSDELIRGTEHMVRLEPRLAEAAAGKARPAGAADGVLLAYMCQCRGLHAAAARLYVAAFAADTSLTDPGDNRPRHSAARAAARAGTEPFEAREGARWRGQALAWLRAELAAAALALERGGGRDPAAVAEMLRRWQREPDLAGVRDAPGLALLPPEESAAWERLWADVRVLLNSVAM